MKGDETTAPTAGKAPLAEEIAGLAVLDDPLRRALYLHVASAAGEVGRDEAAQALGISRSLAGFHLDRLAAEGLLETSFRRRTGRSGPGAGRPAKLYRRSPRQIDVTLPPRRYELAARLLARAVDTSGTEGAREALRQAAHAGGEEIGREARRQAGARAGRRRLLAALTATLAAHGYEPEVAAGELRLRNCPFHGLVAEHTQLVCSMNLALLQGVVAGLRLEPTEAELLPRPGLCCVRLVLGDTGRARSRPGAAR